MDAFREWPAFHLAVYFIDTLLAGYGTDERITNYLSRLNFYVFPVLNPDGFIFSRTSKRDVVSRLMLRIPYPDAKLTVFR